MLQPHSCFACVWTASPAPRLLNLSEFEVHGRQELAHTVAARVPRGESPQCSSFNRFRIRPRVLVDVSSVSTETHLLGCRLAAPFICREIPGVSRRVPASPHRESCSLGRAGAIMTGVTLDTVRSMSVRVFVLAVRDSGLGRAAQGRAQLQAGARDGGCGACVCRQAGDSEVDALPPLRFFQVCGVYNLVVARVCQPHHRAQAL